MNSSKRQAEAYFLYKNNDVQRVFNQSLRTPAYTTQIEKICVKHG
jgi:hypothetical protein